MAAQLRRGRGVGTRGRLRRRAARLGQRQAARPVPVAVLQPAHRRVRRLARATARAILRLIRDAVAERAGDDFPCTVKVPVETRRPVRAHDDATDALRLRRLVEEWGFDAVTPVEVSVFPDTTLSPRRRARLVLDEQGHGDAAAQRRARRGAGARIIKAGAWWGAQPGAVPAGVEPGAVPRGEATGRHPGARGRRYPHRGRGAATSSNGARPTWSASAGRSTPSPTSPPASSPATPDRGLCRNSNRCVPAQMLGMKGVCYNPAVHRAGRDEETSL